MALIWQRVRVCDQNWWICYLSRAILTVNKTTRACCNKCSNQHFLNRSQAPKCTYELHKWIRHEFLTCFSYFDDIWEVIRMKLYSVLHSNWIFTQSWEPTHKATLKIKHIRQPQCKSSFSCLQNQYINVGSVVGHIQHLKCRNWLTEVNLKKLCYGVESAGKCAGVWRF